MPRTYTPQPVFSLKLISLAVSTLFISQAWAAEPNTVESTGVKSTTAEPIASEQDEAKKPSQTVTPPSLQKVLVTAERRVEDVQGIASAVTVVGGDKIRSNEVRNAGDIIRFVPNMSADTTDGHGRPKFYIRGIGLSDASIWNTNPIGTYNDDVYIWNASTVGFPLFDLDRVEVLRGPQGTLWGKNTTGGAINFISKKPTFKPEGYIKGSLGNYGNTLVEGAVSGALKEDVLAARVSIHKEDSDRHAQNPYVPGKEDWSEFAIRTQFLLKVSNSFNALLNVHYRDFDGPVLQSGNRLSPGNTRERIAILENPTDELKQRGATLTLNKEFANGNTLTSVTGVERFERDQTSVDTVPYESSRSRSGFSVDQFSQELRLASNKASAFSWIVGGFYFKGKLDYSAQGGVLPGSRRPTGQAKTITYDNTDYDLSSESFALFGNFAYEFTERFKLAVGLRQTREIRDIDYLYRASPTGFSYTNTSQWWLTSSVTALNNLAVQDTSKTWDALTYDITPTYQFTDTFMGYFRHAKGFNGGNFNAGAQVQNQVTTIDPEYIKSYETGVKTEWLDNRLQVNAAVFYYDYTDIQQKADTLNPQDPARTINTFINAKGGYVKGVDLEIVAAPIENLRLAANLGFNRTKFTDFQASPTRNVEGNWFNRVPRVMSNLQADYRYPLGNGAALLFNTDWAYRSKAYFNATNQTSDDLVEKGYWLGNASAGYLSANNKYEVRAYVLNLTDKEYRNTSLLTGLFSYGPSRTFGVSATYRF